MGRRWMTGWRAMLIGGLAAVLAMLVLGGVFILSGVYNVAASKDHFAITNAIIRLTLSRSVAMHSLGVDVPPDLDDERLARLGARHFELGCAPCHASPASDQNPVAAQMYPAPPALSRAVEHWETEELFWIVKHGFRFTGMPSWPGLERDEEVWALVAFLRRLPQMDGATYAQMAGIDAGLGASILEFGRSEQDFVAMCDACHGEAGAEPVHQLVPAINGQKPGYLARALRDYAEGRRESGIMEPIAAGLGGDVIERLARLYAQREPPRALATADAEAVLRGDAIAREGVRGDDIPPCAACHSETTSSQFPKLEGLPLEYIATQLRLFRDGIRAGSTYSAIMASIARRLSREQIRDVAAYFASRSGGRSQNRGAVTGAGR